MHGELALDLWREALLTVAIVTTPFLIAGLVVGIAVALLQAATQVQEQALSFVPKMMVIGFILMLAGPWILERMVRFSTVSMERITEIGRSAGP
ncbi:MAG: flagellar biosynthetic protein FliQ [Deltaproteobacteria bacterium]|nr:flagellar biosynthetic protein FliQ [Deltaproteobacteria bacterium]